MINPQFISLVLMLETYLLMYVWYWYESYLAIGATIIGIWIAGFFLNKYRRFIIRWKSKCPILEISGNSGSLNGLLVEGCHRGGSSAFAPENTFEAFRQSLGPPLNAKFLEIDVQITKDNQVVIIHDRDLSRTTNGKGRVKDTTYAEIKNFDAAYHYSPDGGQTFPFRNQGVKVPLLRDFLELLSKTSDNVQLLIDFKDYEAFEQTLELVEQYDMTERVIFGAVDVRSTIFQNLNSKFSFQC